jgi:hypothetical protein
MALTTGGTTYVTSTDLVANYPTASLALANRVDVVASGGPNSIKTSGYTITLADILGGNKFLYNSASPGTFTLPTSGLVDGMVVDVAQIGAGALTVSGGTIVGTTVTTAQYQGLRFVYASTGTTWYSIAPAATPPGMALIVTQSFTASSAVSVNDCFSATYRNYYVIVNQTASVGGTLNLRYRVSGADNSTTNYVHQGVYANGATVNADQATSQTQARVGEFGTGEQLFTITIAQPFATAATKFRSVNSNSGNTFYDLVTGFTATTSFTGFTITPTAGNITGTVSVYGYRI